jgi:tol-pal system protein YbgF
MTLARSSTRIAFAGLAAFVASGCVTVAEHRKLEDEVRAMRRGGSSGGERLADLRAELTTIERRLAKLEGRVDEAQRTARQALDESRRTSSVAPDATTPEGVAPVVATVPDAASSSAPPYDETNATVDAPAPTPSTNTAVTPAATPEAAPPAESGASVQEVSAYRDAHQSYRSGEYDACIDRFRRFLQTYPTSPYADDAAYWMAECHFKKGDYKSAVLRFDDVVARYPEGDKSADALYRQGEALLKLGPNYAKAASKAFERVVGEYPSSPRAAEAKKQLELLGASG